ncbi:hypothetical protein [Paraburkholderia heleia]|uniref:hypothetical protein n=1 Tax=Paraburkholderia heleia TaxID=634127 RepID=UPI0005AAE463|nr:hypothetical protein [Paraburkholderia heleia]
MTEQHERTAYSFTLGSRERMIRRTTEPLFDAPTLHQLAAGTALHHIETNDADGAIRWAVALSGLQFSRYATSPAA